MGGGWLLGQRRCLRPRLVELVLGLQEVVVRFFGGGWMVWFALGVEGRPNVGLGCSVLR